MEQGREELQFERLTRELEAERQVVASQLERCRLGAESPSAASARYVTIPPASVMITKSRVTDSSQSPPFHLRSDQEQMSLYSPEQASLPESEGSAGNSRSSTQMNSYSDSGYQEAGSYYSCQNLGKSDLRPQLSYQGPSGVGAATLARNARAEGQAPMTLPAAPGRAMRRVCSVPSRTQSPGYGSGFSPSRASLRGPMSLAEPKALSAIYSSSTLPAGPRTGSPYAAQTAESPGTSRRNTSPHQASRTGMAAVPQHYGPAPRFDTDLYSQPAYDIYDRMILPRPDSLAGLRSSYASQHSQHSRLGPDLHAAMSPERHIMPIYEDQTFQSPLYHSPSRATVDLNHSSQSAIYRTVSGMGNLQRGSSLRGSSRYQRGSYAMSSTSGYAEPYRTAQYRPAEASYATATRSPSIDSIQKDPREFGWRDPELPEVIHMLQHQFPSVQANAAAYLQHLCYGDNRVKAEVCRLGGIQHLVDLLDHKVLDVQKNTCGALRNLVYGKATDDNKVAVRNAGGIPALLRLLRRTVDAEVRELVTGVLWNLSSCDAVKMTIVRDALVPLTNTVVIPHSGWSSGSCFDDDHKLKFHSSLVLRNTSGCLRNLSSAGEEARKQMRCCEGLVDSLLYVIKACVSTSDFDSKIVENCICTLRNLSYRLELEMPQSGLLGTQELDGLLGRESPSKEVESSCWGRRRRKKKKTPPDEQWDGVGPIPGFSKSPRGVEMLWHPTVVKPYLTLLAESSNPATLEGAAGSLQNLSAGNWKFAAYIRAAVRKEKGLPILVELLRMDNDRVVCSVATALRNMALDVRNKELIGKYAMRDLVNRLPGSGTSLLSDETVAAVCCTLHEVTSKNMENAKALADTGGIEKLVNITKGRGGRYSMKVVKAAAQVLNTLWQYRDLGGGGNSLQMSPINQSAGSATSSPAMLGIKEHRSNYQRAHSSMQFYNYQEDNHVHKSPFTGKRHTLSMQLDLFSMHFQLYYADEPSRRNYDNYRLHLQSPMGYEDQYFEEAVPYAADYTSQPHGLKSNTNYVDFYSTTRRPSYRAEQYPGSPDSWV
uniref:Plakophilin 4 n=1 Tax=Scleropages formosus TaxID=113540 RepID=A0A8C9RRE0_SCLFO